MKDDPPDQGLPSGSLGRRIIADDAGAVHRASAFGIEYQETAFHRRPFGGIIKAEDPALSRLFGKPEESCGCRFRRKRDLSAALQVFL